MKVFLAAPFTAYMNPETEKMHEDKIHDIKKLLDLLQSRGHSVCNAHKREHWGEMWMAPETCTSLDYDEIRDSDMVIAIPGNPPSGGVHVELGWASSLGKRIVILLRTGKTYSNLVMGLGTLGKIEHVYYDHLDDCLDQLKKLV